MTTGLRPELDLPAKPEIVHLFSWESDILALNNCDQTEQYAGFSLSYPCPCCGLIAIEVYVDRILQPHMSAVLFENEDYGIFKVAESISLTVVHELIHWAIGSDEDDETAILNMEELLRDENHGFFVNGELARKEWRKEHDEIRRLNLHPI
jgi:hypothetical protein